MLDSLTRIAAFAVVLAIPAIALVVFAVVLRGIVAICNRLMAGSEPVPVPSMGPALGITVTSTFVYGILLIGIGSAAGLLERAMDIRPASIASIALVGAVSVGAYLMARIVADILPSSFRRALAIVLIAGLCQSMIASIAWQPIEATLNILSQIVFRN